MQTIPFKKIALSATMALSLFDMAYAENLRTPLIPGVTDSGTPVEFIKDGFDGTEGPITLPDGSLIFTETKASRITRISEDKTVSTFLENTNGSNGLAFAPNGDLYSVQNLIPKVGIIYPENHKKILVDNYKGSAFQRPNDLVLAKNGGIYFTDIGIRPSADNPNPPPSKPGLYYITPKGVLQLIADDIERPNGVQLNQEETVLYVANTSGEYILAYDIAKNGTISNKRNFAKLAGWSKGDNGWSSGADGLAIDEENRLYVASNSGIEVFTAEGEALGIIPIPQKPQNLAFAGKDKKTLYVVGRGAAYQIALKTPGFKGRAK